MRLTNKLNTVTAAAIAAVVACYRRAVNLGFTRECSVENVEPVLMQFNGARSAMSENEWD